MLNLLTIALRWIARNLLSFVVIVAILVAASFAGKEYEDYKSISAALAALRTGKAGLEQHIGVKGNEALERTKSFEQASLDVLDKRIRQIEGEILGKTAKRQSAADPKLCVFVGGAACDTYLDDLRIAAEITILEQERDYLKALHAAAADRIAKTSGIAELERLRLVHVAAYAEAKANELELTGLKEASPLPLWFKPWSPEYRNFRALEQKHRELLSRNQQAHEAWARQQKFLQAFRVPQALRRFEIRIDDVLQPLNREIAESERIHSKNWVANSWQLVVDKVPLAVAILLSIILAPLAIKAFLYFVVAPIASRRPAILLMPGASGSIEGVSESLQESDRPGISAVSQPITIDQTEELLVHPEYIQSSAAPGTKDTKWLLDWSYPMSSLAAGLFGLTRIRTTSTDSFVVSATRDPFSEIGIISLPQGSAFALQPHSLIGVVQQMASPVRISRHWRLGSLNAWLTLQLRYLVFHGPVRLLVEGCRGVRVEKSGTGRSINQAATIAFSANLEYSTRRCETFSSYLMGKQELFNDYFGGGPGFYVYEEMPHFGKKGGITGRGIEGIADSFLKIFGI